METAAWLISIALSVLSLLWSLVWFLISGWVSTLLQIAVVVFAIYGVKYGWKRAPFEIWRRSQSFFRFFWNWIRAREPDTRPDVPVRDVIREVKVREIGDINVSTVMSLAVCVGLAMLSAT